jgi:Flp pilus assembly pilin Flp
MIPHPGVGRGVDFAFSVMIIRAWPHSGGSHVNDFIARLRLLIRDDRGQTMAEYTIVLAVITIGIIVGIGLLSGSVQGALSATASKI